MAFRSTGALRRRSLRAGAAAVPPESPAARRSCGECSLCCTILRVDELAKLAGADCTHLRSGAGCGIYERRPGICRAYRCLWLRGAFEESDRPDRLGAVVDFAPEGATIGLAIEEARPGAFDGSPRLQEIAARFRESLAVRIATAVDVMDPDRPYRVLLPGGAEHRFEGEVFAVFRGGRLVERRRMPWLDRRVRRWLLRIRSWRLRRHTPRGSRL